MKTDPGNLLPTRKGGSCLKLTNNDRCPFAGNSKVKNNQHTLFKHLIDETRV